MITTKKPNTKFKMAKNNETYQAKLALKIDITMMNMFIGYIFKDSKLVTRRALSNMKQLFDLIDEKWYMTNDALDGRRQFILRALTAKVTLGMENESIVLDYCRLKDDDVVEDIIKNLDRYKKINYEEMKHITNTISERLAYAGGVILGADMEKVWEDLHSGNYNSYGEIVKRMKEASQGFISWTRKASSVEDTDTLSLIDNFEANAEDRIATLNDPTRILQTGIRALNEILSPGYLSRRLYIYMGLPAGFKSGILLKSANDIRIYNRHLPAKKPGFRKTVLFITMENSVEETVERLFNMTVTPESILNFTPKMAVKMLKKHGQMEIKTDDDINIVIKYFPNRAINTDDLYTIIDDLEDERQEVIALILDYIKRIRPAEHAKDEKEELKNITNELKNLATELDIPVITAHQLNRSGAGSIDAAMEANKEDLARFVGRSNVGSAWEVMENADWACIVNVEKKRDTGQFYLTFKRIKIRYREISDLGYFNHPFVMGNRIQLMDDINMEESISEASLTSDFDGVDLSSKKGKQTAKDRDVIDDDSGDDTFDFAASINKRKTG